MKVLQSQEQQQLVKHHIQKMKSILVTREIHVIAKLNEWLEKTGSELFYVILRESEKSLVMYVRDIPENWSGQILDRTRIRKDKILDKHQLETYKT